MPRQVGRSPGNISSVQAPQLTDFATGNYQNVIQKTMDNYAQAMSAAASAAKVDQQHASQLKREAIEFERQRLAQHRAAQEKGGGGGGAKILGAIAGLGKVVAQGLQAQQEIKQQEFNNDLALKRENRAQESHELGIEDREYQREIEANKAQLSQLDQMVQAQTQEWELQLQDTIINGSREAGYTAATSYVDEYRNSEYFKALPPEHQFYINNNMNKWLTQQRGESLSEIEAERRALVTSQRDVAVQQAQVRYAPILQEINTGAGVLTPEEINERVGGINEIITDTIESDPALQGILRNKKEYLQYVAETYKPLAQALNNYFETTGERVSETNRTIKAIQGIAQLENLRSTPGVEMTDSEFVANGTIILRELGLPGSIESFPTTQTNIARQRNEDYAQIEQLEETTIRSDNLRRLGEDDPTVEQARNFLVAKKVYNALSDGSADGDIVDLEYAIKQSPHEAQARGWDRVLSYFKEFDADRKQALQLQDELAEREQQYAALKAKISPPTQVEIRIPGDSGLGVDEQGTPLGTTPQSRVDIVDVERRVPQATKEELDALEKKLEVTRSRIGELGRKWEVRGLDIYNPKNKKHLEALGQRSQAALDIVTEEAQVNRVPTNTNSAAPAPAPTSSEDTEAKLKSALSFELDRAGLGTMPEITSQDENTSTQLTILNKSYAEGMVELQNAYSKGENPDIDSIIKGLPGALPGVNAKEYGEHFNTLKINLEKADKLLENKSKWYRTKWGEPTGGIVPTPNFTDGGQRSQPQTVAVPNNRTGQGGTQIDAPTMPLKGNLAGTKYGYAPFKGGNVQFTSNFGMRTHPVTGKQKMHTGIDIVSNDPRVASIQGGEVVFVGPKDQHNGGWGNYVVVKTPNGKYEHFAHLREVSVTKGQKIDPATQIGLMGGGASDPGRGTSTGRHLHYGVGTKFDGANVSGWIDPIEYMKGFTGSVELPRGQGDLGNGTTNNYQTNSGVSNTGVRKISENVYYSNGYVFDRNTGKFREATPNEVAQFPNYTPVSTTNHRSSNIPARELENQDGTTTIEEWEIPAEARNEGTFLFVRPTGRTSTRGGQPVLAVEGYKDGKKLFSVEAVSGATGLNGDRTTSGKNGMLPEGKWSVATNTIPGSGAGVGDLFLPLTSQFGGHNRSAIGIHYDADGDGDTAGCLATLTKADRDKIYNFVRNSGRSLNLYVNTSRVSRVLGRSTVNSSPTGNPSYGTNQTSPNAPAFSGKNNPNANYGYSGLKGQAAASVAKAGDSIGIPAVWIADYLYHESGFNSRIQNSINATGVFQVIPKTLKWLHPGMTMEEYRSKGLHWQLTVSLPKYIKQVEKDAGKKVKSIHDFAAAIWGGGDWLKKSEAERTKENWTDGNIRWNAYKKKWGSRVGRSYTNPQGGADDNIIHSHPRSNCPQCQQMVINGDFSTHKIGL